MKIKKLKFKDRFLIIFLVGILILPYAAPVSYVKAEALQESDDENIPDEEWLLRERSGYEDFRCIEISDEEAALLPEPSEQDQVCPYSADLYDELADVAARDYTKYSNDYCYNRLNSAERNFYDNLDQVCQEFITTAVDAAYSSDYECYYINGASYSGISKDRAKDIVFLYLYQNPQYYFLDTGLIYNSNTLWVLCYDAFYSGAARATVTNQLFSKVDTWVEQIEEQPDDYKKEKEAHDIVCENVTYQEGEYDQSAYSSVIQGKSVCAGYAKMFSLLLNGIGIETVGMTGSNHAWNKVKLYGKWYNVDTTWDDPDSTYISYTYFNKSDSAIRSGHVPYDHYEGLVPICGENYVEPLDKSVVNVSGITLEPSQITFELFLDPDQSRTLTAKITPDHATDQTVYWTSSDEDVATVSQNGLVEAIGPGKASITAITTDGSKTAGCVVYVYEKFDAPAAPVVQKQDATSITLLAVDDCRYSMDGINWQSQPVFTGLKPNTEYTFYAKKPGKGYFYESEPSPGTKAKTTRVNATVATDGIYVMEQTQTHVLAGLTATPSAPVDLEYRWLVCNTNDEIWYELSGWKENDEWLDWTPETSGNYVLVGQVRVVGNDDEIVQSAVGIVHHPQIKGKCQMPYEGEGGGYLIGFETYNNPNQSYQYEMQVLDCTLLAENKPAWIYTTGRCLVPETSFWTVWQPRYGYYWTLFRVYDSDGNLIDEECYPFVNAY